MSHAPGPFTTEHFRSRPTCPNSRSPPPQDDTLYRGLYLDATTKGLGATHDRLTALALLPFTFDIDARNVTPRVAETLSGPDPHSASGGDTRAPDIDIARASALIERVHLIVS